jgi:hypothetical protein
MIGLISLVNRSTGQILVGAGLVFFEDLQLERLGRFLEDAL